MHTDYISNSAILNNNYVSLLSALCACIQVKKMALQMKQQFFSDRFELPFDTLKSDGLVHIC